MDEQLRLKFIETYNKFLMDNYEVLSKFRTHLNKETEVQLSFLGGFSVFCIIVLLFTGISQYNKQTSFKESILGIFGIAAVIAIIGVIVINQNITDDLSTVVILNRSLR